MTETEKADVYTQLNYINVSATLGIVKIYREIYLKSKINSKHQEALFHHTLSAHPTPSTQTQIWWYKL